MWDVWKRAKKAHKVLSSLHVCRKVLATDRRENKFYVLPSHGRVKDVYRDGKQRWIFVVEKPRKECGKCKKLEHDDGLYGCGVM